MALQITTLMDSIAALDVVGVTILPEPPAEATRMTPVLFPEPLGFITDFTMVRDSFGGGSTAKMTVEYVLHYTFCYAPIGSGRTGLDIYVDMVDKVADILDEILAIDVITGSIDVVPDPLTEFGPVLDPAGNQYLGCRMALRCQEFVN